MGGHQRTSRTQVAIVVIDRSGHRGGPPPGGHDLRSILVRRRGHRCGLGRGRRDRGGGVGTLGWETPSSVPWPTVWVWVGHRPGQRRRVPDERDHRQHGRGSSMDTWRMGTGIRPRSSDSRTPAATLVACRTTRSSRPDPRRRAARGRLRIQPGNRDRRTQRIGKTDLAAGWRGAPRHSVLHVEDLYPGWHGLEATPPVVADLLACVATGRDATAAGWTGRAIARRHGPPCPSPPDRRRRGRRGRRGHPAVPQPDRLGRGARRRSATTGRWPATARPSRPGGRPGPIRSAATSPAS